MLSSSGSTIAASCWSPPRGEVDYLDLPWEITPSVEASPSATVAGAICYEAYGCAGGVAPSVVTGSRHRTDDHRQRSPGMFSPEGHGKGNAVLNIGPGKLSMDNSDLPLRLTGEAAGGDDTTRGAAGSAQRAADQPAAGFSPRCVASARAGGVDDALNIDEIAGRWPGLRSPAGCRWPPAGDPSSRP